MAIYLSTTSTKPSTPEAVVTTGTGGIGERFYLGDVPVGAPTVTYDKINLTYSTGSTSTPQSTNQPPTISAIADQVIAEDAAAKTVAFAVNDTTTSPANLIVTAATSNSTLLPSGNLTLGGSGTNRTVSFRPASNQSGTANITVTVSDGQLTSSDTFVVNVTAVNDAPTIAGRSSAGMAASVARTFRAAVPRRPTISTAAPGA